MICIIFKQGQIEARIFTLTEIVKPRA